LHIEWNSSCGLAHVMGCGSSSETSVAEAKQALSSGPAAKHFFYLDDLPWSIYASADGPHGLHLRVIGADQSRGDALQRLETAFNKRGFLVRSAQLFVVGGLADHSFNLDFSPPKTILSQSMKTSKSSEVDISSEDLPGSSLLAQWPGGTCAVGPETLLSRLTVKMDHCVGLRAAVMDIPRKAKHHVVYASFQTLPCASDASKLVVHDDIWLQALGDVQNGAARAQAVQKLLAMARGAASRVVVMECLPASSEKTPEKAYAAQTTSALIAALQEVDEPRRLQNGKGALKGVPNLEPSPCGLGLVVDGFDKYTGARLAMRAVASPDTAGHEAEAPILEIRTFYVKQDGQSKGGLLSRSARGVFGPSKNYAEFVTWLDVASNTWTIFKVFLGPKLASGQNYGAKATAEHLMGSSDIFFGGGDAKSCSEPVGAIATLKKVVLCDCVNWNTYMLMSIAKSGNVNYFGDHFADVVTQESRASKLTQGLTTYSLTDIFRHTALGKFLCNILALWNQELQLRLEIKDVEVRYESYYEQICGERRMAMDVEVSIGESLPDADLWGRQVSCQEELIGPAIGG